MNMVKFKWNLEKLEGWEIAWLTQVKIPLTFDSKKLNWKILAAVSNLKVIKTLIKDGLISPGVDAKGNPTFTVTEK